MAIQIRELIVRASIRDEREERGDRAGKDRKDEIIEESAANVLQILKNKNER